MTIRERVRNYLDTTDSLGGWICNPRNPEGFSTFLDALYFAIVTMTTVGYGDIIPLSEAGRALTLMMILTGIALIPTQISSLIRYLVKVTDSQQVVCGGCGLAVHDQDARFCKQCGLPLDPQLHQRTSFSDGAHDG
jgi:voltage-gated potassium channel